MDLFIAVRYDGTDSTYSLWIILQEFVVEIYFDIINNVGLAIEDIATLL